MLLIDTLCKYMAYGSFTPQFTERLHPAERSITLAHIFHLFVRFRSVKKIQSILILDRPSETSRAQLIWFESRV